MAVPISFNLGSPPRTIYRDIFNLPDPTELGITTRIFNDDTVDLYFKITGSDGAEWTFSTVEIGLIDAGTNVHRTFDEFASRTKPSSELEEKIDIILRAYTDAGYTDLKWEYTRTVTVVWINSDDPLYTVDELDNFDDGTVQGWAVVDELGTGASLAVATDYYLSSPYSARVLMPNDALYVRTRLYKSFTTSDKPNVFAIIDTRTAKGIGNHFVKYLEVAKDGVTLVFVGRPSDAFDTDYVPLDRWLRVVVPLPRNTTLEVRVVYHYYLSVFPVTPVPRFWMDDFKIISK